MSVNVVNSDGKRIRMEVVTLPETVLNPDTPTVILVVRSEDGIYLGHMETNSEGGHILSEEIRQAAEAASREAGKPAETTLEEA